MGLFKRKDSKHWWYRFNWNGETIRESTKQTNKRVAEQMEAAHRTRLALGEVGIRKRNPAPTLAAFAEQDLMPFVEASFAAKPNTVRYYSNGVRALLEYGYPLRKDGEGAARDRAYVAGSRNPRNATHDRPRGVGVSRRQPIRAR
jgi:hypothetical protein